MESCFMSCFQCRIFSCISRSSTNSLYFPQCQSYPTRLPTRPPTLPPTRPQLNPQLDQSWGSSWGFIFECNFFSKLFRPQLTTPTSESPTCVTWLCTRSTSTSNNNNIIDIKQQQHHRHQPPPSESLDNDHDSSNNGTTILDLLTCPYPYPTTNGAASRARIQNTRWRSLLFPTNS